MSNGLTLQVCRSCGCRYFPARLLCGQCGAAQFDAAVATTGVLEQVTTLHRAFGREAAARVGSIRVDDGPLVIVRVGPGCLPGEQVDLAEDNGVPVAARADSQR